MDMKKICKICHVNPKSHSFSKLCEKDNVSIFFTKVSEAEKFDDREGILQHMDNMLTEHVPNTWAWIFDADGFEKKHLMQLTLTIDIIKLINQKYATNLEYIQIKNSNPLIKNLYSLLTPILKNVSFSGKVTFD